VTGVAGCRPILNTADELTLSTRGRPLLTSAFQMPLFLADYSQLMSPVFKKSAVTANTSNMPPNDVYACQ
jgi:hypothetical protein